MASALDLFMHRLRGILDPARHTAETDGQLLARWADAHDDRAFAALVSRHGALVWRVSKSVLPQAEDAEDIFQATFFVLARKADSLQRRSSVAGWLYETAHRLALKTRKSASSRLRREARAEPGSSADPLQEISAREAQVILGEELKRLTEAYREPILLCLFEGATQDQAAGRLGYSLNTLRRRLERGRALLARRLSARGLAQVSALPLTLCLQAQAPARLVHQTITLTAKFAAGQPLAGAAALLAHGLLQTMLVKKVAAGLAVLVALTGLTVGGWTLTGAYSAGNKIDHNGPEAAAPNTLADAPAVDDPPRADANGDPLPTGAVQRIGSQRLRLGDRVNRMAYTPDGKAIASTTISFTNRPLAYLNLMDAATGKIRWRINIDDNSLERELAVSPDGKTMAVVSDFEFLLVTTDKGEVLRRHQLTRTDHDNASRALAIAADLGTFARGCFDATVRLYDAATGEEKIRFAVGDKTQKQYPLTLAFSPDGKTIYAMTNEGPGVHVFDAETGVADKTLPIEPKASYPCRLAVAPNKSLLVAMDKNGGVLWDVKSRRALYFVDWSKQILRDNSFQHGAFSSDSRLFAGGAMRAAWSGIFLYDVASGEEKLRLPERTSTFAFAPDGKTLASSDADGCVSVWDVATGQTLSAPEPKRLRNIRFAANGNQIVSVGADVTFWDLAGARAARHLALDPKWHNGYLPALSPDEKSLVVSLGFSKWMLIDAVTGKPGRTFSEIKSDSDRGWLDGSKKLNTAFSPDGTKLFSAGGKPSRVYIWDVATSKVLHELQNHTGYVDTLAVSPDGRWLASASVGRYERNDQDIRLWEVATGKLMQRLTPRPGTTTSFLFSSDGSRLVACGANPRNPNEPGEVQLWDVATGKEILAFRGHQFGCVAMTPDGRMLATGTGDKTIEAGAGQLHSLGGWDKTFRLWEVASGKERGQIAGHETPVFSVDFSPSGRLLAAASNDAPIYLWDVYALQKLKTAGTKLTQAEGARLWQKLADADAVAAFQAICELIAHPNESAAILEEQWKRLPRATPRQMHKLVEELSSDQFAVRKTATEELDRFAYWHEDLLRAALQKAGTLEARQRLEKIVGNLGLERLRRSRMLEVFGQLPTTTARPFLERLAEQTEDAFLAREAAGGLKRLGR